VQAKDFSSIRTRDLINNAFKAKGIQKPVVSTATLSIKEISVLLLYLILIRISLLI
jgi:hypothetical protein